MPKKNRGNRPPAQSQTQRPQPKLVPKKAKAPKRGTINLTVFEQEVFRDLAAENSRIVQEMQQLHNDRQLLQVKQNRICDALGTTHKIDCTFKVTMNKAGTAINWEEVPDGEAPKSGGGGEPDPGADGSAGDGGGGADTGGDPAVG